MDDPLSQAHTHTTLYHLQRPCGHNTSCGGTLAHAYTSLDGYRTLHVCPGSWRFATAQLQHTHRANADRDGGVESENV